MLNFSPFFGAFFATLILLVYPFFDGVSFRLNEIGSFLTVFPFVFTLFSIFSFISFYIVKKILVRNKEETHFIKMWKMFFAIMISFVFAIIFASLSYYNEQKLMKAIFIFISVSACITLTYSFYVSLLKELKK